MDGDSQDRIRAEAAHWYARLSAPDCTPRDRAEFTRWLYAEPRHRAAYEAAEAVATDLAAAASSNHARLTAMADWAYELGDRHPENEAPAHPRSKTARRRPVPAALAASLIAAAVVVFSIHSLTDRAVETIATEHERRELGLSDGSVVHLDVDTEIGVEMLASERTVSLLRGRAVFRVAHDPERPFSVVAGAGRIEALGTVFQVQRDDDAVIVTLTEGSIEVSSERPDEPCRERLEGAGQQIGIPSGGAQWRKSRVDPDAATAWSTGRLVFRDRPLADAIDEINRYATVKVRLADPSLADLAVSGSFVQGDSRTVVTALAAVLPLRLSTDGRDLLLFRRATPHEPNAD